MMTLIINAESNRIKLRLLLLSVFASFPSTVFSQGDLLDWIDANSTAVVVVKKPEIVVDQLVSTGVFDDPMFRSAIKYLTHEKFPIVHATRLVRLKEIVASLRKQFAEVDEFAIVVHSLDDGTWSLLIDARPELIGEVSNLLKSLTELLENADQPLLEYDPEVASELPNEGQVSVVSSWVRRIIIKSFDNWILISNSPRDWEQITKRRDGIVTTRGAVSQSRKFQTVRNRFSKTRSLQCAVEAFGNPKQFRTWFSDIDDQYWEALDVDELPSFGMQAYFILGVSPEPVSIVRPNFVFEVNVALTNPRHGISKVLESYKPIVKIPELGVSPLYFSFTAYDAAERDAATELIFDLAYGDNKYFDAKRQAFEDDPRDYFLDVVPKANATYSATYQNLNPESSLSRKFLPLIIERVENANAARRYLDGLIEKVNRHRAIGAKIVEVDSEYGALFAINTVAGKPGITEDGFEEQSYFLNDHWYITGAMSGILRQLEQIEQERLGETGKKPLYFELFSDISERIKPISSPFRIDFYSDDVWSEVADYLQWERLADKASQQLDSATIEDPKPNEEGIFLEVESHEDVETIVIMQIRKAIANSFGNQIIVASQTSNQVQIFGGLYSADESISERSENSEKHQNK